MSGFDTMVMVDWSARSAPSPAKPTKDAIFLAISRAPGTEPGMQYHRTRASAEAALTALFEAEIAAGRQVLAGFDFPFGYPKGFAQAVTGTDDPLTLWDALAARIEDGSDNTNNRWQVAGDLNRLFPGVGPFWGNGGQADIPDLPRKGLARSFHGLPERRKVEERVTSAFTCWQLAGAGAVGSQVLMGLPMLSRLRHRFGPALAVSPFQPARTPIVLAEIYPSLLADLVKARQRPGEIRDAAQVRIVAKQVHALPPDRLQAMLQEGDAEEGWILGVGYEAELEGAPCPA